MIISFRDFDRAFENLNIPEESPVIVHVDETAFDEIIGGNEAILGALFANFKHILMPAFTPETMLTPRTGPANNAINYHDPLKVAHAPDFFQPDMSVSSELGEFAELFRAHQDTSRSRHPVLSFTGHNLPTTLSQQTLQNPFGPITYLEQRNAWVLLVGTDQIKNTSLHIATKRAGRPQFVRWALSQTGIKQLEDFPGCSDGFEHIRPHLNIISKRQRIGEEYVIAYPLKEMLDITQKHIQSNPLSMLCDQSDCLSCHEVRNHVAKHHPKYQSD